MLWDKLFWDMWLWAVTSEARLLDRDSNLQNTSMLPYLDEFKWKICIPLDIDLEHPFLEELKSWLNNLVVWQEVAKENLSEIIVNSILSIKPKKWPLGVLFFHWPTWVWKTEMVKALSEVIFWDSSFFIKINCENYAESHTASNLFWSPKWYVWYNEPTPLTNKNISLHYDTAKKMWKLNPIVGRLPRFNIILFDEIEKAHFNVTQQLLAMLDDGKIQLSNWEIVNFHNSIIVFTSNLWQPEILWARDKQSIWFSNWNWFDNNERSKIFQKVLKGHFSPEFIWRIHNFIEFNELTFNDCKEIINIQVRLLNDHLIKYYPENNIQVELSDSVYDYIIKNWFSKDTQARDLVRFYEREIEYKLNKLFNSDWFVKYFSLHEPFVIHIWLSNNNEIKFHLVMDENLNSVKLDELKQPPKLIDIIPKNTKISLDQLSDIYKAMCAYVELTYINLGWTIEMKDELKIYADKLVSLWISRIDLNRLKTRAYIEWLNDLNFIDTFYWINLEWDQDKLFTPFDSRTIIKIVERKFEAIYDKNMSKEDFVKTGVEGVIDILTKIFKTSELTWAQINQVLIYIRKTLVDKWSIYI